VQNEDQKLLKIGSFLTELFKEDIDDIAFLAHRFVSI